MATCIVMLALSLLVLGATQGRTVKDHESIHHIKDLKSKVHNLDKKLLKQHHHVKHLKHAVEELKKVVGIKNETQNWNDCPHQPEKHIKNLVKSYEDNLDWAALRRGLKFSSGIRSTINDQLDDLWFGESSPLYKIGSKGFTELATLLICSGLPATTTNKNGGSMLHGASASGNQQIVQLLLRHGADLNKKFDGKTPLIIAAEKGHLEVVKALVQAGAKTSITDKFGHTALWRADWNDKTSVAKYLKRFPH